MPPRGRVRRRRGRRVVAAAAVASHHQQKKNGAEAGDSRHSAASASGNSLGYSSGGLASSAFHTVHRGEAAAPLGHLRHAEAALAGDTSPQWARYLARIGALERELCVLKQNGVRARYKKQGEALKQLEAELKQLEAVQRKKRKEAAKADKKESRLGTRMPNISKFKLRVKGTLDDQRDLAAEAVEAARTEIAANDTEQEVLCDQCAGMRRELAMLRDSYRTLQALEKEQAELLKRMFTGAAGDEEENRLEQLLGSLDTRRHKIAAVKTRYDSAYAYTKSAGRQLEQALQALEAAGVANQLDMLDNFGGLMIYRGLLICLS
jgi:hypothetical protein